VTEAELLAHCAAALARYKIPRTAMFVDALPATQSARCISLRFGVSSEAPSQGIRKKTLSFVWPGSGGSPLRVKLRRKAL
jgi:hypothetical protein